MSLLFTWLGQRLAPRLGLCDYPDDGHKQHGRVVALGGWTLALATLPVFFTARELWGLWIAGLIALTTGLLDDRFGLSPRQKLLGQSLAALVALFVAHWEIRSLSVLGLEIALGWLSLPFTLFWIVGAINALNLIDGLDGLATGVALIVCLALAMATGQEHTQALLWGFAGALLGFLVFNFCPARVFLGDGGAHFLGYWLAILSVGATQPQLAAPPERLPLVVAVLMLGLPIADTAWAILRRLVARRPVFQADRGHMHHRLLARGWGERRTVIVLYLLTAGFCALALVLLKIG
ncbi:MAG: undecaprenyl/decaprenyl-phosphate alpha-N-acetylglucosaminyl 1-phosphate transferase [Candidatus Bipolaricaulota bacterium]|nr:undecaprenyl/decaprenyl-phosphate alpha-N-acetylglucosaminyl 1-phosphate transferase [Candidatus Bipolaricaulota bacterium]MDW8111435.1 MraY family glycosyltransferase [Candidatus Bipolaricaulota bacterium]MDW8329744.1 MraY family glycosyltransferase [Candidatus Bipolaricaulota bacterium]